MTIPYRRLDIASDIPEFVAKISARNHFALAESLALSGTSARDNSHAQGVGSKLRHNLHWVNDIPLALAHLLIAFIVDHAMQIDVLERYFVGAVETKHYHTPHPLIEDVKARFHHARGIKAGQRAVLKHFSRNKWPLTTTKPCIKRVFLPYICCAIYNYLCLMDALIKNPIIVIFLVLKRWNWDPPWYLSAQVPITQLIEVLGKYFASSSRGKRDVSSTYGGGCTFG